MDIPKIKRHTFYGKTYRIKFGPILDNSSPEDIERCKSRYGLNPEDILALTDNRGNKNQTILVSDNIEDDKVLLRVLLDEGLHACDDRIDNDVVDGYATSLSNFLWRCGYRRSSKQTEGLNK